MFNSAPLVLPPKPPMITLGANPCKSRRFLILDFSNSSVNAVKATGTSWELSTI